MTDRIISWIGDSLPRFMLATMWPLFAWIVVLVAVVMFGGCQPYATAWRATASVKAAGNLADDAIAESITREQRKCIDKHCGDSDPAKCKDGDGYLKCITPHKAAGMVWMQAVRPAINSALQATISGLTIAERVKLKPDFDWMSAISPAVCALAKIAKEWSAYFGAHKATILSYLAVAEGVSCE